MNHNAAFSMPMSYGYPVLEEENFDSLYFPPHTTMLESQHALPYTYSPYMATMDSPILQGSTIPTTEDYTWLQVPNMPKMPLYSDSAPTDTESLFSWPTPEPSSHLSESPQSSSPTPPADSPQAGTSDLLTLGAQLEDGSWRCTFPGCSSKSSFERGCDLRKHYKRHSRHLFCRNQGCPKSISGGFSSRKDRARHEARHNPTITCEWEGCTRLFSRMDNMRDHYKRVHQKHTRAK